MSVFSDGRARTREASAGAVAEDATLLAELQRLDDANVIRSYARLPVAFVRGAGAWLWDSEGNEYLDFLSGISVNNVGHCHPRVVEAVRAQAGALVHVSNLFHSEPGVRLATRLATSSLGGKVFLCNSGAEANEAAIKLARKAKPKGDIVSVFGAFHGRTYGALSATPQEAKQAPFAPLVPGFRAVAADPDSLRAVVDDNTAAVLLEPIQGETGVHVLDERLLQTARELCDAHGAALIFDEVQCGMGRTGSLWAFEQLDVRPDALTTAKGLGGGLPIGALITNQRYADVLVPGDHGTTFGGGPLVAAAALAALEVLDDDTLLARVRDLGELMRVELEALPQVREVRGRGLMLACEIETDARELVEHALLQQRLVINATGPSTLRLLPPLIIDANEAREGVRRLGAALAAEPAHGPAGS